jgi:hypothetical protein
MEEKYGIVVADRGFVYVGKIKQDAEGLHMEEASCIRRWGTTKGLGQLALEGPQENTVLDKIGSLLVPSRAVITIIDTEAGKWEKK